MKRFQVISEELNEFDALEGYEQYYLVDYINCPYIPDCEYNGKNIEVCDDCKIKRLLEEWG